MSIWAFLLYAAVLAAALFLLFHFKAQAWYWHALSILAAVGVGLTPPPANWSGPKFDLLFGCVFLFLFAWGLGGFVVYRGRSTRHRHA